MELKLEEKEKGEEPEREKRRNWSKKEREMR